jgi:hypothetical protein
MRFEMVLSASSAVSASLNNQATKRTRFGTWLGLAPPQANPPQQNIKQMPDGYITIPGDSSNNTVLQFREGTADLERSSSTDECVHSATTCHPFACWKLPCWKLPCWLHLGHRNYTPKTYTVRVH